MRPYFGVVLLQTVQHIRPFGGQQPQRHLHSAVLIHGHVMQQTAIEAVVRCLAGDDAGDGGADVWLEGFGIGIQLLPLSNGLQLLLRPADLRLTAGLGTLKICFAEGLVEKAVKDRVTAALQLFQLQLQAAHFLLPILSAVG